MKKFFHLLFFFPSLLFAIGDLKIPIAILDFKPPYQKEALATELSDYLRNKIFKTNKYLVLGKEDTLNIVKNYNFLSYPETQELGKLTILGRFIGVDRLVTGEIKEERDVFQFSLRLVNCENGTFDLVLMEETAQKPELLKAVIDSFVKKLQDETPWLDSDLNLKKESGIYVYIGKDFPEPYYQKKGFWIPLIVTQFLIATATFILLK